jgi:twitching motility protein PilT
MSYQMSDLLQLMVSEGGADLHVRVGIPPVIRIHGVLQRVDGPVLRPEDTEELMRSITSEDHIQNIREKGGADFGFAFGEMARFRVSAFKEKGNFALVLRQIPSKLLTMEQIGIPPTVKELLWKPRGLVLVTGPTGSGKTTTLASLLNIINEESNHAHIITIEEPSEYVLRRPRGVVTQREVGVDTASFSHGLRESLRQGPDVIMVGEVRDRDTADTMLRAAESGHLVLATVHSSSAEGVINKIVSLFHPDEQTQSRHVLKNVLIGVICQVLLPRLQRDGFALAAEILINNPQVARAIEDPARMSTLRDFMRRSEDKQSRLLNDVLVDLVRAKRVSRSDALLASYDRQDLLPALDRAAGEREG